MWPAEYFAALRVDPHAACGSTIRRMKIPGAGGAIFRVDRHAAGGDTIRLTEMSVRRFADFGAGVVVKIIFLALAFYGFVPFGPALATATAPDFTSWKVANLQPDSFVSPEPGYMLRTYGARVDAGMLAKGALVWEAQPRTGSPGGYLVMSESPGRQLTVTTRISFSMEDGEHRIWLAGIGFSPDGPPCDLALTLVVAAHSWFGAFGDLRLEGRSDLFPPEYATKVDEGVAGRIRYCELAGLGLSPDKTYEAKLSYDGVTGLTSVMLIELGEGKEIYSGHLYLNPSSRDLYPGTGGLQVNGKADQSWRFMLEEFLVRGEAQRLGVPLALQGDVHFELLSLKEGLLPGSVSMAYPDEALRATMAGIGPGLPGDLRIIAISSEGKELELWREEARRTPLEAPIPPNMLLPGQWRIVLEYVEPDYRRRIAEEGISIIEARIKAKLSLTHNRPWETGGRMDGEITLEADRDAGEVKVSLLAAPEDGPPDQKTVWEKSLVLMRGKAIELPLSFTVEETLVPHVFTLTCASSRKIDFDPQYDIPRTFYVSPKGNDGWSGYLAEPNASGSDGPFRTIARARDAIRALKGSGMLQGPATVFVREGIYYLDEPLVFTPEDSGTEAAPVTYSAYPGEKPVISGGRLIKDWRRRDDGLWVAELPDVKSGNWYFRTLRVGTQWAIRARYPNFDPAEPLKGGWLFAEWWGESWEKGSFNVGVGNIHNPHDRLEWNVTVPVTAEYQVWVRYAHNMKGYGIDSMDERTILRVGDGSPVSLNNLPDTGSWGNYRWSHAGAIRLQAGSQILIWENIKGGGINLDAFFLTDNPKLDPDTAINISSWDQSRAELLTSGAHFLLIQAEACTRAIGKEITVPVASVQGSRNNITLPADEFPDWDSWDGAEVHIFPAWGWVNAIMKVNGVDREKRTLLVDGQQDIRPGNRFFIANVREALDSPGEWYLDSKRGELLYLPKEPCFPDVEVVAPAMDRLMVLRGVGEQFVEYLHFRGLTFTDTDYTLTGNYYTPADAAIWLTAAREIVIEGCIFVNLGGYAVRLEDRSHENEIVRNEMQQLGQGGVIMLGNAANQPHHNLVAANDMHDLGAIYKHVAGVYVTTGSGNRIAHNRIQRVPRYAISLKSFGSDAYSHDNIVEFNEVVDTNLETNDTGAIETLGRDQQDSGNIIRFNFIRNVVGMGTNPDGQFLTPYYTWGIYLDDYSSGTTIYGNIVIGTVLGAIMVHGGKDNRVENNIFLNGSEWQLRLQPRDDFARGNVFRRNIVAFDSPTAGLWYSPGRWRSALAECNFNIYWHTGGLDLANSGRSITPEGTFAQWRSAGFDRDSLIVDPLFADAAKGDFRLESNSPAFGLGFEPIPIERIGPKGFER